MKENPVLLTPHQTIAVTIYPSLGDSLVFMILAHNLRRNGFKVTVFNHFLASLQSYFPDEDICSPLEPKARADIIHAFDLVIYTHHENVPAELDKTNPRLLVLEDYKLFHIPLQPMPMVGIVTTLCQKIFNLTNVVNSNGFKPHPTLTFRKQPQRVVIHPSASIPTRKWSAKRFIALARQLRKHHYEPVFVVGAYEQAEFLWIIEQGFTLVANPTIETIPGLIYESGWFIGNDSGIGHLASNAGIPTITLATGRNKTVRWRPGWAPGAVLFPRIPLIRGKWKRQYWRYCISVSRVMKTFTKLTRDCILES